jgi:hypothetical protein
LSQGFLCFIDIATNILRTKFIDPDLRSSLRETKHAALRCQERSFSMEGVPVITDFVADNVEEDGMWG